MHKYGKSTVIGIAKRSRKWGKNNIWRDNTWELSNTGERSILNVYRSPKLLAA